MKRIVVIGGGPGGVAAAVRASQLGADVFLVEADQFGGTCVNEGCVPMRILGSAAETCYRIARAEDMGLEAGECRLRPADFKARIDRTLESLRAGTRSILTSRGISLIHGRGHLLASGGVTVGGKSLPADAVILAAGSEWDPPSFAGANHADHDVLQFDIPLPKSLMILGGEPWSVEMALYYQWFKVPTTLVMTGGFFPGMDRQIANRLRVSLKKHGVTLFRQARVTSIVRKKGQGEMVVSLDVGGETRSITAHRVLATERRPHLNDLGLEEAGVRTAEGTVLVDAQMRTNRPGVYAVGDLVGGGFFSHKATEQGVVAAENAMGKKGTFRNQGFPKVLYTQPEVAVVGMTEQEARSKGYNPVVSELPYEGNARAVAELSSEGYLKVVFGEKYHEVLGVHIIGPQAVEMITQASMAMGTEVTAEELARLMAPHPSYTETLVEAARTALGTALHTPKQRQRS